MEESNLHCVFNAKKLRRHTVRHIAIHPDKLFCDALKTFFWMLKRAGGYFMLQIGSHACLKRYFKSNHDQPAIEG